MPDTRGPTAEELAELDGQDEEPTINLLLVDDLVWPEPEDYR